MDNPFETSFIPQQPFLAPTQSKRRYGLVNFPLILSLLVFFVAVGVAAGVFFYERHEEDGVNDLKKQLSEVNISSPEIMDLKQLNERIRIAKDIVGSHKVMTPILRILESVVAEDVYFSALRYTSEEAENADKLVIKGIAKNYAAAYFQREKTKKVAGVKEVEVSELRLNEGTGLVGFDMNVTFEPDIFTFRKKVSGTVPPPAAAENANMPAVAQ